jgi:hypothetical protein
MASLQQQPPRAQKEQPWWVPRYQNHGKIEQYLGDTQPFLVEILAVRVMQVLNGHVSLDWTYQNCTLATVRSLSPGFRWAYLLTGVYMVLLSVFWLETPLFFRYDLVHDESTMIFGNTTLGVCMFLWSLDYAVLAMGWLLVARAGAHDGQGPNGLSWCCACFAMPTTGRGGDRQHEGNLIVDVVCGIFFIIVFALGALTTHTILGHIYAARNVWFAALLGVQALMLFISALGDLCSIGSPWGIQEHSHLASILLSFRGLLLVPLTVIWSIAAVIASFPPSYCETC